MNIEKRIQTGEYTVQDLLEATDSNNPIVLYQVLNAIGSKNIQDDRLFLRVKELGYRLNENDSALGAIKIGHMAIATLVKLGFDKENLYTQYELDEFNQQIMMNFFNSNDW